MHLESKEELHNLAVLRNVCLEQVDKVYPIFWRNVCLRNVVILMCFIQARQAYLAGNDGLSKELTLKGQLYNMQIKTAQEKAKEAASQYRSFLMIYLFFVQNIF
jgi:hypothetical protein